MKNFVITGCSEKNNLGFMIAVQLKIALPDCKIISVCNPSSSFLENKPDEIFKVIPCDLSSSRETKLLCLKIIGLEDDPFKYGLYCLINCAGINRIEWIENSTSESFDKLMAVNARASYEITKGLLPPLTNAKGTVLNIVSNASHIPMTCSLAYNASKAAAKMVTKQMAHELTKKYDLTIFSISPNKLKNTGMSAQTDLEVPYVRGWTPEFSEKYQLDSLATGRETSPWILAEFIAFILSDKSRHFSLSGCDIEYGA